MKSTYTSKKRGRLMQVKRMWCDRLNKDNCKHKFYITHSLPRASGRKHHSPPYNILCNTFCGSYIQMAFFSNKILKLGLLLSQNFGHSYFPQIKYSWNMWKEYLIALKIFFQGCIARPHQRWFDLYFKGICGQDSNSQFDSRPFFWS
jgi:hypothetical protein